MHLSNCSIEHNNKVQMQQNGFLLIDFNARSHFAHSISNIYQNLI